MFWILEVLIVSSRNILSEAVLLVKSLKLHKPCHVENNFYLVRFDKIEHNCCFSDFLIIGLCNSSANSWFDIFSFLAVPPEARPL